MRVTLVCRDSQRLGDADLPLYGAVDHAGGSMVVFPADGAPPGAVPLGHVSCSRPTTAEPQELIVYRHGTTWKAHAPWLASVVDVDVRELADVFSRTPYAADQQKALRGSKVLVLGLGSFGSEMSSGLAQGGVGGLLLVDPDRLELENIYRHRCTLLDLGRRKVDAVADHCRCIAPSIDIKVIGEDLTAGDGDALNSLIRCSDLIVEATDRMSVKAATMDAAFRMRRPIILVGSYENAWGGECFYWLPDEPMPCYCCLPRATRARAVGRRLDYTSARGPEDYLGEPGLGVAVRTFADIATQVAFSILLRNTSAGKPTWMRAGNNYLLIGSAASEGYHVFDRPFQVEFQPLVGINPQCPLHHPERYLEALETR